jgi:hypothetical protein
VFPLHVEAGKRYLLDTQGQPFFVHGDAAWSIMLQLTRDQVDQYLEDRRQKGFNTILVNLIEHHFADNAPNNVYGDGPFTTPGDFSTPNEAYFSNAEYVISKAGERGFLVLLAPAYMGFEGGDEGWYQEMVQNGATKLRGYGQYVANRFKAYGNVLWVEGGDYDPPETALVNAVANGIRDVDAPWLQTFEGRRGTAALDFFSTPPSWLTVNDIYTDESTVVSAAFQEYSRSAMPFFLIEALYEGEGATAQVVRAQAYQATLSGAAGHVMGNNPVWSFSSGWQSALNSPGAVTLTHFRNLVGSIAWWSLQPDTDGTLLTAGVGSDSTRAAAAVASDRSFALIYTPEARDLSVNLSRLNGPNVRARWYDPTSGSYQAAAGLLPAAGSQVLRPDSANAAGDADWVLVLDSQP